MGDSITLSIFWGFIGFILTCSVIEFYLIALSVLIAFSIINYWIKINIKEICKILFFNIFYYLFYGYCYHILSYL
ncbi:hypothetical protein P3264_07470 [Campylobacter jejuni]|nr:hypothetical protein P3264_07470 [Campylobacter jejuni]